MMPFGIIKIFMGWLPSVLGGELLWYANIISGIILIDSLSDKIIFSNKTLFNKRGAKSTEQ
jgi:hypothetical protein